MIVKRMLRTAPCCLAGLGAGLALLAGAARADVVTGISSLSQSNRLSIFHDYSLDAMGLNTGDVPGSAGGGVMTHMLGSWASTDPTGSGRSYEISITPLVGYDSNPEARRGGQGSAFGGGDLAAQYNINLGPNDPTVGSPTQFKFSYDATGAIYDGTVFKADTFQQTLAGSYHRDIFHDTLALGFAMKDQFTTEDGNAFLNTFDAIPSVEWFVIPQASLEANYDVTRFDYFAHHRPARDPSSVRNTINTEFHFYPTPHMRGEIPEAEDVLSDILRESLHRATIGYAAVFNEGTGSDYNYEANRVYIGMEGVHVPHMNDITMDVEYAHEWDNYMRPNFEGPEIIAGRARHFRRKDHIDVFTLRANARLFDLPQNRGTFSTFLQWDLIADRANIESRHFNEFIISGGVKYAF